MKKSILLIISAVIASNANLSVKQIENMVLKIHQKRLGADIKKLDKTFEPFAVKVVLDENKTQVPSLSPVYKVEAKIQLHAIVGKKAFLNDKWLEVNDTISGYTLKYIGKRGVVLQSGNNIKKLIFHDKKNSIIKLEGR